MATAKGLAEKTLKGDGCPSWLRGWLSKLDLELFGPAKVAYASFWQENAKYHGSGQVCHIETCSQ